MHQPSRHKTWCDMARRLLPWIGEVECDTDHAARAEAAEALRESAVLAPIDAAQADYLESRGALNGFTAQLQVGFRRHVAGE